jgi:hypothetical protein
MSTNILLSIAALIALASIALTILLLKRSTEVNEIWDSIKSNPDHTAFTADMVAALPTPVQLYFLHAIAPGTPLARGVQLEMQGSLKVGQKWMPMRAREILSAKGFVWKAAIGQGLLTILGADYYARGKGRVHFSLWGIWPVADAESSDTTRSALGRLAGELIWLPSALLPQQGVTWEALENNTIQASLAIDGEPVTLTLEIAPDGRLLKLSFPRWGDQTADGSPAYIPFGGEIQAEQTFGGFTIPSQVRVGWWFGSDRYVESFRATFEQAEFS